METVIGKVVLTTEKTLRQGYEVACWEQHVNCKPQTTDLKARIDNGKVYWAWYGFEGEVVSANFPAVFGGVQYANPNQKRYVGKNEHVSGGQPYGYNLAKMLTGETPLPEGVEFKLNEGFEVKDGQVCIKNG